MIEDRKTAYKPSCMPTQVGTCAQCELAYDCQSKMNGRLMPWPLVALGVVAVVALVI
jgi:hypothetical protein